MTWALFWQITVVQVAATDGDAGAVEDAVVYDLLGTGAGTLFTIDPQTGNITLTGVLDREEIPRYVLSAMATDDNGNGLSSYVDVIIEVEDINDNVPFFPDQEYVGSVDENMPPSKSIYFTGISLSNPWANLYSLHAW